MPLDQYRRKRNFKKTAEPPPKAGPKASKWSFVVQKHAASRLHYDFRLELDGVLKSWAVPKGPSLDPAVKSLAVEVEDHPVAYAKFEGVIPEGEYGGGTVLVWDEGRWEPEGDPHEGLRKGDLKFRLDGKKLKGSWVLVRMRKDGQKKNWLLIKHKDADAIPGDEHGLTERLPASIVSDRSMEDITRDADRVWTRNGEQRKAAPRSRTAGRGHSPQKRQVVDPSTLTAAREAKLPKKVAPQLATLSAEVPSAGDWLHEIKFDGYRILAWIDQGQVRLMTRRGHDWTARFSRLAESFAQLPVASAILDGELVALDASGATSFQKLQVRIKENPDDLVFYAFDLIALDGYDLHSTPLIERKQALAAILKETAPQNDGAVRYSDHVRGDGEPFFKEASRSGLEGIVSKRATAKYEERRSRAWLKIKCHRRQEFVITGFTRPEGSRVGFGALVIGFYEGKTLRYAGRVGTGFDHSQLTDLTKRLKAISIDETPFAERLPAQERKGVTWVRPELVAEVRFAEWTDDGILRHASFLGLREDKAARDVVRETSIPSDPEESEVPVQKQASKPRRSKSHAAPRARAAAKKEPAARKSKHSTDNDPTVAGVTLTHPDRVLYPDAGITKQQIAEYYAAVEDWVIPYLTDRPLTIVRCPQGQGKQSFYQKHWAKGLPEAVDSIRIEESDGEEDALLIHDLAGVVSLVQMSVLEFHPWSSKSDKLEQPDQIIFDLDPGPGVNWKGVVQAAEDVRDVLTELGLTSFVRTSGGKGLHVVAPLTRRNDWDEVKSFAERIASGMSLHAPDRYVANMRKNLREGKVFIDYLRNQRGATAVGSYSTRNRPGAPVATPVAWKELAALGRADAFTALTLPDRLRELSRDPWDGFFTLRQSITREARSKADRIAQPRSAS